MYSRFSRYWGYSHRWRLVVIYCFHTILVAIIALLYGKLRLSKPSLWCHPAYLLPSCVVIPPLKSAPAYPGLTELAEKFKVYAFDS